MNKTLPLALVISSSVTSSLLRLSTSKDDPSRAVKSAAEIVSVTSSSVDWSPNTPGMTGASLTGLTVMANVLVSPSPPGSVTANVPVRFPKKSCGGVKLMSAMLVRSID